MTALAPGDVVERADELLEATYFGADLGNLQDVLGDAVCMLLSGQTSESVGQVVFAAIRSRFPTWSHLRRARLATVERFLVELGIDRQGATDLQQLVLEVDRRNRELGVGPYGGREDLTLEFLSDWAPERAVACLESLPGIDSTSARRIVSNAAERDNVAADSHVRRILARLGVVADAPGELGGSYFQEAVPSKRRFRLRTNLVHHGLAVCHETAPRCDACPLVSFCDEGRAAVASQAGDRAAIDLFAGAGAMGLGFEEAGFRVITAVELDRHAAQTYRLNHPGVPVLEASVETVTGELLRSWVPGVGVISAVFAGPPCQGYSAAGARTVGDHRNLLFQHVSRIARELDSKSVMIENVPGVRRVNGVSYTARITASLRDAGYTTWGEPAILRAADFGVPQNRHRLFFVGVGPGLALPEAPTATHRAPGEDGAGALPDTPTLLQKLRDLPALAAGEGHERFELPDGSTVLNSTAMRHSAAVVKKIAAVPAGKGPISYRRLDTDVARTLVAGHRALPIHPTQHRAITVREAARIQGFPDTYFFCGPRASQPLQVANAVPPSLARAVATSLRSSLDAETASTGTQPALGAA